MLLLFVVLKSHMNLLAARGCHKSSSIQNVAASSAAWKTTSTEILFFKGLKVKSEGESAILRCVEFLTESVQ